MPALDPVNRRPRNPRLTSETPNNPGDYDVGEHDDLTSSTKEKLSRGVYEDGVVLAGGRRFLVVDSNGDCIRIVEEPAHRLVSRTREEEIYRELGDWLDREDPPRPKITLCVKSSSA